MKPTTDNINYKNLIILKLKNKLHLFLIGFTIIIIFLVTIAVYIPKRIFTKKTNTNKNFITKEIKLFPKIYITKEGDFLWQIAEQNYGSGLNAYDIAVANNLEDPNNIPPGTKLTLPAVTPKAPTKGEITAIQSDQVTYKQDKYIVKPGDSLSSIALAVYGDLNAWPTILRANNLPNAETIEIGMILTIPR